jgi:hypothetical protein
MFVQEFADLWEIRQIKHPPSFDIKGGQMVRNQL